MRHALTVQVPLRASTAYEYKVEAHLVQSTSSRPRLNAEVENTIRCDEMQAPNVPVPGRMYPPDRLELLDCTSRFSLVHAFNHHRTTASDSRFRLVPGFLPFFCFASFFPSSSFTSAYSDSPGAVAQSWAGRRAKKIVRALPANGEFGDQPLLFGLAF